MNGVPLRRVNQAYVIATSTKVDITAVKLPEIDDAYFAKEKVSSKKTKEEQFFAQSATVSAIPSVSSPYNIVSRPSCHCTLFTIQDPSHSVLS